MCVLIWVEGADCAIVEAKVSPVPSEEREHILRVLLGSKAKGADSIEPAPILFKAIFSRFRP